ncbi:MAG: hypothetical protein JF614_19435 [Acidobacteria bacterium]|nr:hypothetical protein [Acidobacteriota bacterium]
MSGDHPDSQLLERFMRNQVDASERRAVVLHLLGGCAQCVSVTRRLWNLGELQPEAAEGDAAAKALMDGEDALDRAELLESQGRSLAEQDRLDDAECVLGRALALYRALGERHREGRVLILAAVVRSRVGGDEAARETFGRLREGLAHLDEDHEPALAASGFHRLTCLLAEAGQSEEALVSLRRARALYERLADAPNLVRLRRLEGALAETLGAPEAAEAAFRGALQESLREGLGREAARALLGLALLYARQGRSRDLERLTEELYPICRVPDVGLSVTMALLFFRRLVETGFATQEVLCEVARFLADSPKAQRAGLG